MSIRTIAKVVCNGAEIYRKKLRFAEALERIDTCYRPYHAALQQLLDATHRRFGHAMLIDCHSMPSIGGPMDKDPGARRVDFVLGDAYGAACHPSLTLAAEAKLRSMGYAVHRNMPYAGGYTTRHYGGPVRGQHALQIEINRALYMDEIRITRKPFFEALAGDMCRLARVLGEAAKDLRPA
jgi:N-formylglutamate amidohydrolase